ncbi:unnamed protein product [Notodromas monacha]|uniref:Peptidase S1 domain-containing protein n=1 Tax=Notodromas monacha TaxID=399045 RepID=A0A7R9BIP8_9CRUS|nr:unnamed protein product [Notodromas monacha]CAG0915357.1 unnamed protein product [Notodromas monacha]
MSLKKATAFVILMLATLHFDKSESLSGGSITHVGEFPHIVSIQIPPKRKSSFHGKHGCSATLITKKAILTAAHCCSLVPPLKNLVAGIFDFYAVTGNEQRRTVKNVFIHPLHNTSRWIEHDICIMEPDEAFDLNLFVWPASLPALQDEFFSYDLLAYGWGDLGNGAKPSELHKLWLQHITDDFCSYIMGDQVGEAMLCAGDPRSNSGTCKGDSGGPLVDPFHSLVGIISWTIGACADPNKVSVFAQVSRYMDWIFETVTDNDLF